MSQEHWKRRGRPNELGVPLVCEPPTAPAWSEGVGPSTRDAIVFSLNVALANVLLLAMKTRQFRWNASGAFLYTLRRVWARDLVQLSRYADRLANRVRTLASAPIGTFSSLAEHASLKIAGGDPGNGPAALATLRSDHDAMGHELRMAVVTCNDHQDFVTAALLVDMIGGHEQMAAMHRDLLESGARPIVVES